MNMTEAEQIMKRCQVGTRNYNEANNLHADCYRVIGKLLKTIEEMESQNPVAWRWETHNGYAYSEQHYEGEDGQPLFTRLKEKNT